MKKKKENMVNFLVFLSSKENYILYNNRNESLKDGAKSFGTTSSEIYSKSGGAVNFQNLRELIKRKK